MSERRDFLLALSAMSSASAEAEDSDSLYIPKSHVESDRPFLLDFLEEFAFALVITAKGGIRTTNVPTLLDRSPEGWGKIWWHLAKNNPQNAALTGEEEALAVFHGPHGYISPNWYNTQNTVPTWNFAVVHLSGKPKRVDDEDAFAHSLERLVQTNEKKYGGGKVWDYSKLPAAYLKGMRQGIVAYEMTIDSVEAKFKLGHERSALDRASVLKGLAAAPKERTIFELTRDYYARLGRVVA